MRSQLGAAGASSTTAKPGIFPKRVLEASILSSAKPPPSKSFKPTNSDNVFLLNARSSLRPTTPTASTENLAESASKTPNQRSPVQQHQSPTSLSAMQTSDSDSDSDNSTNGRTVRQDSQDSQIIVTITSRDQEQDFSKISRIRIARELSNQVSFIKFIVHSSSTIRVTINPEELSTLASIDNFLGASVEVSALPPNEGQRDYTWGKIFSHELFHSSESEILEELQVQNENIIYK